MTVAASVFLLYHPSENVCSRQRSIDVLAESEANTMKNTNAEYEETLSFRAD